MGNNAIGNEFAKRETDMGKSQKKINNLVDINEMKKKKKNRKEGCGRREAISV